MLDVGADVKGIEPGEIVAFGDGFVEPMLKGETYEDSPVFVVNATIVRGTVTEIDLNAFGLSTDFPTLEEVLAEALANYQIAS